MLYSKDKICNYDRRNIEIRRKCNINKSVNKEHWKKNKKPMLYIEEKY